jgi:hypothetical protein
MSEIIKGALIVAAAIILAAVAQIYFSPVRTCARAMAAPTADDVGNLACRSLR